MQRDVSNAPAQPAASSEPNPNSNSNNNNTDDIQGGWFGSVWSSVVEKSAVVVDMYKRDLGEFSSTISRDTKTTIQKNLNEEDGSLVKVVHDKLNTTVAKLSSVAQELAATDTSDGGSATSLLSGVLCNDPSDIKEYNSWKATFNLGDRTDEISRILADQEVVRSLHAKLGKWRMRRAPALAHACSTPVPADVPYRDFWLRYFYRRFQQEQEKQRREQLVQRATAATETEEELATWGDDDEEADNGTSATLPNNTKRKESEPVAEKETQAQNEVTPTHTSDEEKEAVEKNQDNAKEIEEEAAAAGAAQAPEEKSVVTETTAAETDDDDAEESWGDDDWA